MTDRRACPTCGRQVAFRNVRGPRVNRGRPIPPLQIPVRHLLPGTTGDKRWCAAGEGRRT